MTVQIIILQNTHNGRDTHIRNIKLFSPREHNSYDMSNPHFISADFTQFQNIH